MTGDRGKLQNLSKYKGNCVVVTTDNSRLSITTTRKKAFVDSFSPSRYGVYVKIGYHSYISSMPVSRKVKSYIDIYLC